MAEGGWRTYLQFTRQERWAVTVLVLLTLLAWTIPYWLPEHPSPPELRPWPVRMENTGDSSSRNSSYSPSSSSSKKPGRLFAFDPNLLDVEGWKALGLEDRTVQTILKYRSKGGRFRQPDDIKRIYGLSEEDATRLLPFVRISEIDHSDPKKWVKEKPVGANHRPAIHVNAKPRRVEVNGADSLSWLGLPGIGPGWASRILRFRRSLGGFTDVGQVAETYGLPDSVYLAILPYLEVDLSRVQQVIDINHATVGQLAAHPYISFKVARGLVAYRELHGPFASIGDMGRVVLLEPELLEKIRPYLKIE